MYELNNIVPIEFLLSTLRLAKHLERIAHEFLAWVDELECIDETHLMAIIAIYAKKHRRKHLHDQNIPKVKFRVNEDKITLQYVFEK